MRAPRSGPLVLLVAAAAARLLLQVLAMAPYAGLDEAYHVARVAFVAQEGRQPTSTEPSLPRYLATSMAAAGDALPAFGLVASGWPGVLAEHPGPWVDVPLTDREPERVYVSTNYEAQQPSPYYAAAAAVVRAAGTTQRRELLVLRLLAVPFGVAVVVATGLLAAARWGTPGLLAGLLVVLTPTWLTLVARAGNDAPACAALAIGLLLSSRRDGGLGARVAEAAVWCAAVCLKLTTWPAALLLPLVWPRGTSRARRLVVAGAVAVGAVVTAFDLVLRSGSPVGDQGLWAAAGPLGPGAWGQLLGFPWASLLKGFLAQVVWTSGQHANALRPGAMLLYVLPVAVLAARAPWRSATGRPVVGLLTATALLYAIAEVGHDFGFVREALVKGLPAPAGALAGWYVLTYVPIWFGAGLGFVLASATPGARAALVVWAVSWDVLIHEGALFSDYAGLSSPLAPGLLFRWGGGTPWEALATLHARGLAGITPGSALLLRLLVVSAALGLVYITREEKGGAAVAAPPGGSG